MENQKNKKRKIQKGGNNAVQNAYFIINERRNNVAKMYIKGKSLQQIADALEVAKSTIHADVQALTEMWVSENSEIVDKQKSIQLEKLNILENELWDVYVDSKKDTIKITKTIQNIKNKNSDNDADTIPMEIIKTEITKNIGDTAILSKIANIIDQRSRILGLYTINIKGDIIQTNTSKFDNMSIEQIEAYIEKNKNSSPTKI